MAHQRRGERPGDRRGYRGGVAGVGLVLLALTLAPTACGGGGLTAPGTAGTGGGVNSAVVGTWQAVVITPLDGNDFVQTTTTWIFRSDGTCRQTVATLQFSEGITRTTVRNCTYQLNQGEILVLYEGADVDVPYPFSKPLNDPNVLVLSGIPFDRI
jgi:hypothetical protein